MALLRLDRERGDRARLEPLERDRLARLLAKTVGAVLEAGERGINLGDQRALAVARAQLDRAIGLRRRAVGKIGVILVLGLKMGERFLGLLEDFLLPSDELLAEILPLALVHERLFVGRSIELGLVQYRATVLLRRHANPVRKANPPARAPSLYRAARRRTTTELRWTLLCGILACPLDGPNLILARARCRPLRREADTQIGEFLEQSRSLARGQAEHTAAACPVGGQKVEVPAGYVDGAGSGREAEPDQGTVDVLKRMDNLLRLDHFR